MATCHVSVCSCLLLRLRLASRPAHLSLLACSPPFARVVWRGGRRRCHSLVVLVSFPRVGCDCVLLRDGDECVDFVDCLLSVDWRGCHRVYCILCLVDGTSADFVGFLGRCLISSDKAGGFSPPHAPFVFSFLWERRGRFFISRSSSSQYILWGCLLACSPIAIEWDKCVASPCSDIDIRHPFHLALPPLASSSRLACLN